MADEETVALIEDPRFAAGAAAGVLLVVLIIGVHAKVRGTKGKFGSHHAMLL